MSEELRRQLAERLYPKKNRFTSRNFSTPSLHKPKLVVPALSASRLSTTQARGSAKKGLPTSLHIAKLVSIPEERKVAPQAQPECAGQQWTKSSKVQLPPLKKAGPPKLQVHGDGRLLKEEDIQRRTQSNNPTTYDLIQTIKNDPELTEDFWYCNRKEDAYDFETVPFKKKNPVEYLTISSRGITHFARGEASFLSLEEWEREYRIYQKLKQINFFKKYKKWKNFSLWKNLRRRNMMNERASFLGKELLLLDEQLRGSLFEVRQFSWDILRLDIVNLNMDKVRSLEEFNRDQDAEREKVAGQLEDVENKMKGLVLRACRESLESFRLVHKINVNTDDPTVMAEDDGYAFLKGDLSNKHMPYTQESMIRTHYKRLTRFIQLCDYQIIDSKLKLSLNCVDKILKTLKYEAVPRRRQLGNRYLSPLLRIVTDFEGRKLSFSPDKESIKIAIDDAILRGLTMLLNNYMLVHTPDFERYTKALDVFGEKRAEDEFDLLQLVVTDERVKKIEQEIKHTVEKGFDRIESHAKKYIPFLLLYHENTTLQVESFRTAYVDNIKSAIDGFKAQHEKFQEMPEEEDLGIFQLNTKRIKDAILPSPLQCLATIEKYLPEIALESAERLSTFLTEANKDLRVVTNQLEEYVAHHKCIREVEEVLGDTTEQVNDLKDLMQLLETCNIPFSSHVKASANEALFLLDKLKQNIQGFNERAESDSIKFTRQLRDKIQQTDKRVNELKLRLNDSRLANKDSYPFEVLEFLATVEESLDALLADTTAYNKFQVELEIEPKIFSGVLQTQKDFRIQQNMWRALHEWHQKIRVWTETPFVDIDVEQISQDVNMYYAIAERSKVLEEQGNPVPQMLRAKVEVLKDTMPVVVDLRCSSLKERHWALLKEVLAVDIDVNSKEFSLNSLLEMKVGNVKERIAEVARRARKEDETEHLLDELVKSWETVELQHTYDKAEDCYMLVEVDLVLNKLDETQVELTKLSTSRYVGPLYERVEFWCRQFKLFSSTFDEWLLCQKQWVGLRKIFKNSDIVKKLKDKHKKLAFISSQYQEKLQGLAEKSALALPACTKDGLLKQFQDWNKTLEKLQKSLEEYLDKQRAQFPRFFFLSNDELILILSIAHDPRNIQPFLKNIFEGTNELTFDEDNSASIKALVSAERESIEVPASTKAKGNIEEWLKLVETAMLATLKKLMLEATREYPELPRTKFILSFPSQVVATVSMIVWCHTTEEALAARDSYPEALDDCCDAAATSLEELTALAREEHPLFIRRRVTALITQDVHNRDVLETLREEDSLAPNNFKWQKQVRYYWNHKDDELVIKQIDAQFTYGYEFLGATTRLVITPLTERCWMTITQALALNLGANPTGPAGTGKTESTKDLAKAMGRYCIVFNCSEQVTYQMMGKLFTGLCYTGSWSCLDEFNRIDLEVLSVIAAQLRSIKQAKDEQRSEFTFEDKRVALKQSVGVFITMNPGYIGRSELPDNLKVLFRPIAMMVPKYTLIAEIMLSAEGFNDAKRLAKKLTKLYKLCSEQLSQQDHYDFGLRGIKAVLNMAGLQIRKHRALTEDALLIRAICEANVPKFLAKDAVLFEAILKDLFPDAEVPDLCNQDLAKALAAALTASGLQPEHSLITKAVELSCTLEVRFGVIMLGPPTSGKTAAYKALALALAPVLYQVINPKSVSMGELFGQYNSTTQDWKDGLASAVIREYAQKQDNSRKWVVFDGPVDSLWVENMNTVLDDNLMLCLANQERIKLNRSMNVLFEVLNLSAASPATVSRCGMVYFDAGVLEWRAIASSWLSREFSDFTGEKTEHIWHLIVTYLPRALTVLRKKLVEVMRTIDNNLVISFCRLFSAMVAQHPRLVHEELDLFKKTVEKLFVFCLTWSVGGAIDNYSMTRFDQVMSTELALDLPRGSLYDSFVAETKLGSEYRTWESVKPDFSFSEDVPYHSLVVPTKDTVRYGQLLLASVSSSTPVFFTGQVGVGKTLLIRCTLSAAKKEHNLFPLHLSFSNHTTSSTAQDAVLSKLEVKRKDVMGGPGSKKVVIVIDDVNMTGAEPSGCQPPVELLRQLCDHEFIYSRDKRVPLKLLDSSMVCCAAPPGGGRHPLSPRFLRHFFLLAVPEPGKKALATVFKSIAHEFFNLGFNNDVGNLCDPIVRASVSLYQSVRKELLPTPAKSHYNFNLRDIASVFKGLLMAKARAFKVPDLMIQLWVHESLRVYCDRMSAAEDKQWFCDLMLKLLGQHFMRSYEFDQLFGSPVIFCDFLKGRIEMAERDYEMAPDAPFLQKTIEELLARYTSECMQNMDLVFFSDAIQHLCRICRVLRQPRGSALLVGVSGCGRSSLARLASYICMCSVFQAKDLKRPHLKEELKTLFKQAGGCEGTPQMFLVTDSQLADESFLEDISSILSTGEIMNLFTSDEIEHIEQELRPLAEKELVYEDIFAFFIERVRTALHVVLCMSPAGNSLKLRLRMHPALLNACTIDWFQQWPSDALLSVARCRLEGLALTEEPHSRKEDLAQLCTGIHVHIQELAREFYLVQNRRVYTTPKSFLDLITVFSQLFAVQQTELSVDEQKYSSGVQQIIKTSEEVVKLEENLILLRPQLDQKQIESLELAREVEEDSLKAKRVKEIAEEEEREVHAKTQEIRVLQESAETELNQAMPMLEEALKAVRSINPIDITEIRTFTTPPALTVFTLEAIAVLFEVPTSMESIRNLLQHGFLDKLQNFPRDSIKPITLKKLKNKLKSNPNFTPEQVGTHNVASKSLCQWVHAIENYAKISREVEPKKKRLQEMDRALHVTTGKLQETQDKLSAELAKVQALEDRLTQVLKDQAELDDELQATNTRLTRASVLTEGLKDESCRWELRARQLAAQRPFVLGDTFLAAACVNYFGPFTATYRQKLLSSWHEQCAVFAIQISPEFSLQHVLADPLQLRAWNMATLPTDAHCIDNAILVEHSKKWPLMIDPQEQANKWIKKKEEHRGLRVLKHSDKDMARQLEHCMREGVPLLVEDVPEALSPAIDAALSASIIEKSPGVFSLRMGDSELDYDRSFTLFLTSKLANPEYLPEVCIRVNILNFTVTVEGLQEQLLGEVVRKEAPEIEANQNRLIKEIAENERTLRALEASLLSNITEIRGNILDDADLIAKLEHSKLTSSRISRRVVAAEKTRLENERVREHYKAVARRGSLLYFVLADLVNIDHMYQNSLANFTKTFNHIIAQTPQCESLQEKIQVLVAATTRTVFFSVCRGLFNSHKLLFSFLIAIALLKDRGEVLEEEWNLLLRGPSILPASFTKQHNPAPGWISEKSWNFVIFLQNVVPVFCSPSLCAQITANLSQWRNWVLSESPQRAPVPSPFHRVSVFHKLLLVRAFREEKVLSAVTALITEELGEEFISVPPTQLDEVYSELKKKTPLIFILNPGADPSAMITRLAQSVKCLEKLDLVSLGKGQEERAKKKIELGHREGKWVVLQNCHLARSWMPELERIIENFEDSKLTIHEEFRLILTSMPFKQFPVPILQAGVKVTIEPPKGLRTNLQRTVNCFSEEKLQESTVQARKLLFALAFFHGVVQERTKYGALGWNIRYQFSETDFETSVKSIESSATDAEVPWEALRYLIGQIHYGGRVTDKFDRKCLASILETYVSPDVSLQLPEELTLPAFARHIAALPVQERPETFGLHSNAEIAYEHGESSFILATALCIPPKERRLSSSGRSRDEVVDSSAAKFLEEAPTLLLLSESVQSFGPDQYGLFDGLNSFLFQEMNRFNLLITTVRSSLDSLRKALKGECLMSSAIDELYLALFNNAVPGQWAAVGYPSLKPLSSWFCEFKERVQFIRKWLRTSRPPAFSLSAFFFPQGFLTAVLQNYARKFRFPINDLTFAFDFQNYYDASEIEDPDELGVYIYGLHMEGCRWDLKTQQLGESEEKQLRALAPVILFVPAESHLTEADDYIMPVYRTSARAGALATTGHSTNYIISIECPTTAKPAHWTLRGAACICELND